MKIRRGSLVELEYQLETADGEPVESAQGDDAVRIRVGDGDLPPGVEQALVGLEAGARLELQLSGEDAFGEFDPEQILAVPLDDLPSDVDYRRGDWLPITFVPDAEDPPSDEEALPEGEVEMRIVDVDADAVYLDGNHPLAGQEIRVSVVVLRVSPGNDGASS